MCPCWSELEEVALGNMVWAGELIEPESTPSHAGDMEEASLASSVKGDFPPHRSLSVQSAGYTAIVTEQMDECKTTPTTLKY